MGVVHNKHTTHTTIRAVVSIILGRCLRVGYFSSE
jgi:hypothetical protein